MRRRFGGSVRTGLLAVTVALTASGCAKLEYLDQSLTTLPNAEAVVFKADPETRNGLQTYINGIGKLDEDGLAITPNAYKCYTTVTAAPGSYTVQLRVFSPSYMPAYPILRLDAKPGMTYTFSSIMVMDGKGIRGVVREEPTAAEPAKAKE